MNRDIIPLLSKAAQSILPVPCASSLVERVFSIVGLTVTLRRKSLVPKLVETIVIMLSNKGRIDFSDFKEEKEECSSSDEDDVESEPEPGGESAAVEQMEVEDNENDSEGENEGENVSLVQDDSEPQRTSTQLPISTFFLPMKKVEKIHQNHRNQVQAVHRKQVRAGYRRKQVKPVHRK